MSDVSNREFAPRGPVEVAHFLDAKAQELDQLNTLLQNAHETAEAAEEAWTTHYDEILEQLEEESENGRLPGEDMRISIARRRDGAAAWTNHRRAERLVKKLEKRGRLIETAISACQSEAKLLRAA
jgi:vacuolar-type H+-ATPase subunit I/STV1